MRSIHRGPTIRTDQQILDHPHHVYLLRQVAAGRVVRGEDGHATAIAAGHYLDGGLVRLELRSLARDDLIVMPISGPPRIAPRGEHLLRVANGEVAADRHPGPAE